MAIEFIELKSRIGIIKDGKDVGWLNQHVAALSPNFARKVPYLEAEQILTKMKELQREVKP